MVSVCVWLFGVFFLLLFVFFVFVFVRCWLVGSFECGILFVDIFCACLLFCFCLCFCDGVHVLLFVCAIVCLYAFYFFH